MAIRPIVRLGHPALRIPAEAVDPSILGGEEMQALIDDLFDTMEDASGVGLAATQVGLGLQLFVYLAVDPEAADDAPPPSRKVLVNPMLEPLAGELAYDWEGCLSIPDMRGLVPRHPQVQVHALDRQGQSLKLRLDGYEARIVQHEFDHLNGIVFLDRMRDLRSLCFTEEWERYLTTDDEEPAAVG